MPRAPGFADSPVVFGAYTVVEDGIVPVTFGTASETTDVPFVLTLSDAPTSFATICYTLDGSTPTCNTPPGGTTAICGTGVSTYAAPGIAIGPSITGVGGQVTVIAMACSAGSSNSPDESQVYTLALAPPYVASGSADGTGLPGWDWAGTGAPITTAAIPADAGLPYGPFVVQQVGSPPCTGASSCSGTPLALADYVCWSATGPATCACASPLPLSAAAPSALLPASADVEPGGTLSVIACQAPAPANATGYYAPSSATTVQF